MGQKIASLHKKINIAGDLQSVVRTMKAMAASNVSQYEASLGALADYNRTVELGLGTCFRKEKSISTEIFPKSSVDKGIINIVVFGSDQGLVGQFNDIIINHTFKTIQHLKGKTRFWSVGERAHSRLIDGGLKVEKNFTLPTSIKAITPLVGQILIDTMANEDEEADFHVAKAGLHLIYNQRKSGAVYAPIHKTLLPLDNRWQRSIAEQKWPDKRFAEVVGENRLTMGVFLREYLFVSLFSACAESLASENTSRLAAMERADKNIDDLLTKLNSTFNQLRQSSIDEELFDIISGYEM